MSHADVHSSQLATTQCNTGQTNSSDSKGYTHTAGIRVMSILLFSANFHVVKHFETNLADLILNSYHQHFDLPSSSHILLAALYYMQ